MDLAVLELVVVSYQTNTLAMIDMFLDGPFSLVSNHTDFHHMILSRDQNVVETHCHVIVYVTNTFLIRFLKKQRMLNEAKILIRASHTTQHPPIQFKYSIEFSSIVFA